MTALTPAECAHVIAQEIDSPDELCRLAAVGKQIGLSDEARAAAIRQRMARNAVIEETVRILRDVERQRRADPLRELRDRIVAFLARRR